MTIIQDGEKFACDACIKGHRVSACSHKDRPLQHVNKKGRPVSQCQHCRGLRKSRSTHIKCVCAEHGLKEGSGDKPTHNATCQCSYGLPCTCAPNHENLSPKSMSKVAAANLTHRRAQSHGKPTMTKRGSDTSLPLLQPGQHHPPLHRSNHSAHEFGHPYKVRKFNASTGQIQFPPQRSDENVPLFAQASSTQPSTPFPYLTLSEPMESIAVQSPIDLSTMIPAMSIETPNPFPDLNMSLMNSALSPANPARYSMNDFSWAGFTSNDLGVHPSTVPPMSEQGSHDFSSAAGDSPQQYSTIMDQPYQRSSVVSLDQPGLTHSPSASASDIGDLAVSVPDTNYSSFPLTSTTIDPSWMNKDSPIFDLPPLQGVTHDLVYRPSQQSTSGLDDYFTAPVVTAPPPQTRTTSFDESNYLTPTINDANNTQSMVPAFKLESPETLSLPIYQSDLNLEQHRQRQFFNNASVYQHDGQHGEWC